MKSNKKLQIKHLRLSKTKTPSSLYLLINDFNRKNHDKQKINLIPLSKILKIKNKNEENKEISFSKNINSNIINKPHIFPSSLKSNSLMKYKSLSNKIIPLKHPSIILPKIKSFEESSSEIKGSKIDLILKKFDECDDKFKKNSKYSLDVEDNIEYMQYKLNRGFNNQFNYRHIGLRYNYKKIFLKLYKRIKKIKAL